MESIHHFAAYEGLFEGAVKSTVACDGFGDVVTRVGVEVGVDCRLNTVVCGVVLNDLNIRCNVNCATVIQKGSQVMVDVLDVVPDCLKIKVSLMGEFKDPNYSEYSKVL